jgi:hypothetical protein
MDDRKLGFVCRPGLLKVGVARAECNAIPSIVGGRLRSEAIARDARVNIER